MAGRKITRIGEFVRGAIARWNEKPRAGTAKTILQLFQSLDEERSARRKAGRPLKTVEWKRDQMTRRNFVAGGTIASLALAAGIPFVQGRQQNDNEQFVRRVLHDAYGFDDVDRRTVLSDAKAFGVSPRSLIETIALARKAQSPEERAVQNHIVTKYDARGMGNESREAMLRSLVKAKIKRNRARILGNL